METATRDAARWTVAETARPPSVEPRAGGPLIDERTIQPTWAGEILDLDLAVIAIRSRNGLPMT